jgi:hypothetical protein
VRSITPSATFCSSPTAAAAGRGIPSTSIDVAPRPATKAWRRFKLVT